MSGIAFAKTEINSTLKLIARLYRSAYAGGSQNDARLLRLYSNMSIVSLSGWLEDGMDSVVDIALKGLGREAQERLQKKRDGVHGASYKHFADRLQVAFGAHGLEFIESQVGPADMEILKGTLGTLKSLRDDVSHSYKVRILRNPDVILSDFVRVYPILKKFEQAARSYRDNHLKG